MIVVVCPGQGSQTPGFLAPWLDDERAASTLSDFSETIKIDLAEHGTNSDADTIRDTAIAQPLIVAAGLLTIDALRRKSQSAIQKIGGVAGHSVGEITAASLTGVLSPLDAMKFVAVRGRAMADAAALEATSMAAVIGGDPNELDEKLTAFNLNAANMNGAGQVVIAGTKDALAAFAAAPPSGSRVIPLAVAGAFHTRYMASAQDSLLPLAATITPKDPALRLWTNHDGSEIKSGRVFLDLMVGQVSSPVRWDLCMESFLSAGVTGIIELAPAGALTGLAKRGMPGIPTVAVKTPEDLDTAVTLLGSA